jgi:C4-dicarboxylate-specific signal transduction histidine kinase
MAMLENHLGRGLGGTWPYRLLIAAALLIPALLFGAVAWEDRGRVLRNAEQEAQQTVDIFRQHALNVFETHELIAARISEHLRGMTWDEIAGAEALHRYLKKIQEDYPQAQGIWLADPAGLIRNSSRVFPTPPADISDRDYFIALQRADQGTFIGHLVYGRILQELNFNVARRRESETDAFEGVIVLSVDPQYFNTFWQKLAPHPEGVAGLVRTDGMILARVPDRKILSLPKEAPLLRAVQQGREGSFRGASTVDGIERLLGFRKVGRYPVFVAYGLSVQTVLNQWRKNVFFYGVFLGFAALALALIALLALRRAQREISAVQERRRAEAQMQELRSELLHVSRLAAMGQMASVLAHELNQPLAAAANYLSAAKRLPIVDGSRATALVDKAGQQILRAGEIIQRLRDFVSKGKLTRRAEDLGPVLKEAVALALMGPKHRGIRVIERVEPSACSALIDRIQIQQVLVNLIRNAAEAMDGSPRREITLATAPKEPGLIEASVADTGPGMPADVVGRLFEPFVTTKPDGMGVGLSICRTIIEAHGGHIRADANPEGGMVFRFTLEASA